MAGKRAEALLETMSFVERYTLTRAWEGLTDDELLWEPLPGSWSVRPVDECRTPNAFVVDGWAADFDLSAMPPHGVEPLTTIGWLFWHVGSMPGRAAELDVLGGTHTAESGWTSPYLADHPIFTTAGSAVATMRSGWRSLEAALQQASDEDLERPTPFWGYGGPGPMATGGRILASIVHEVGHHGTQVCVLRDLYRLREG